MEGLLEFYNLFARFEDKTLPHSLQYHFHNKKKIYRGQGAELQNVTDNQHRGGVGWENLHDYDSWTLPFYL